MPPSTFFSGILNGIANSFLGGGSEEQATSPTHGSVCLRLPREGGIIRSTDPTFAKYGPQAGTHDTNLTRAHATDGLGVGNDVQEVPRGGGGVKRTREGEGADGQGGKRARRESGSRASALVPDYRTPAGATSIAIPGTYDRAGTSKLSGNGARMGGFRPMDTLGHAPHAPSQSAKAERVGTPKPKPASDFHRGGQKELQTKASRGSNVLPRVNNFEGKGNSFVEAREPKRRKTADYRTTNRVPSDPVDLTNDDDAPQAYGTANDDDLAMLVHATVVNQAQPSRFPDQLQASSSNRMRPPAKEESAMRRADAPFRKPPPKRRPKQSPSSQGSQAASVVSIESSEPNGGPGSRHTPLALDDDGGASQQQRPTSTRRSIPQYDTSRIETERLSIDLGKGMEEAGRRRIIQGSTADIQASGDLLQRSKARRPDQEFAVPRKALSMIHAAQERQETIDGSLESYARSGREQQQRAKSPDLRAMFKRAPNVAESSRKVKATERMQADSRASPRNAESIDDSVDELQGESTMGTRVSRNALPQKKQNQNAGAPSPSGGQSPEPSRSRRTSEQKKTRRQKRDELEDEPRGPNSWPISAFYSEASCITGGEAKLVYDPHTKDLELWEDQLPKMVPNGKRSVSLGSAEAHKVFYNSASNRVYVTGSSTDVSHGSVCIAFLDHHGVDWFLNRIAFATHDNVTISNLEIDRLDKIFAKQCHHTQQACDMAKTRLANAAALEKLGAGRGMQRAVHDEDEEIEYEVPAPAPPPRPNRRQSMLGVMGQASSPPADVLQTGTQSRYFNPPAGTRRSTREKKVAQRARTPSPPRWTKLNNPKPWTRPVEYPPQGIRRITVDFSDIERLDEGEFLNDNVISFGLRKIEEEMDPQYREQVHFFNSFFYASLTTKNGKKVFNYDGVKKWTKNKDILSLPYVVVPINIDLHWFVAIICNLDQLDRKPAALENGDAMATGQAEDGTMTPADEGDVAEVVTTTRDSSAQRKDDISNLRNLSISDEERTPVDEHGSPRSGVFEFGDDDKVSGAANEQDKSEERGSKPGTATGKKGKKRTGTLRKYDVDKPAVITLDSFGSSHTTEARHLKDYIVNEAGDKRGMEVEREMFQGVNAKGIPQQTNFCDCGVYLLGYVEQFAKNPRAFANKVMSRQLDEQADFATFDPSAKRAEIRDQLLKLSEVQEAQRKEQKKAKATGGVEEKVVTPPTAEAEAAVPKIAPMPAATERPASQSMSTAPSPPRGLPRGHVKASVQPAGPLDSTAPPLPSGPVRACENVSHAAEIAQSVNRSPSKVLPPHIKATAKGEAFKQPTQAKAATSRPASITHDDDEDDQLEMGAATALPSEEPSRGPLANRSPYRKPDFNGSESSGEEDEMLDRPDEQPSICAQPQAPAETGHVTDDLMRELDRDSARAVVGSSGSKIPTWRAVAAPAASHAGSGVAAKSPNNRRGAEGADEGERMPEIADSQEGWVPAPPQNGWHGKYMRFDD